MSLSQIYEGWKNNLTPEKYLSELVLTVSDQRMAICRECPLNSIHAGPVSPLRFDEHCTKCHCTLSAKTKCLSCSCPDEKWLSVITPEEEKNMSDETKV